jgi:NAD(P)-dependent dehydrogenase (short-subunit alcohol dehydrogenase family)
MLDVTDDRSVTAAAKLIEHDGGLDVLINNAGVEGRGENNAIVDATGVTADMVREVFDTNVFGVVRVTHAFLPLLQKSRAPVVVNVSSTLGSVSLAGSPDSPTYLYPGVAYPASKSALNMITVQFAKQFPGMRINAVEPGFTDTDLNGHTGTQTVEEGARIIVDTAQVAADGPTGGYFSAHGPIAW